MEQDLQELLRLSIESGGNLSDEQFKQLAKLLQTASADEVDTQALFGAIPPELKRIEGEDNLAIMFVKARNLRRFEDIVCLVELRQEQLDAEQTVERIEPGSTEQQGMYMGTSPASHAHHTLMALADGNWHSQSALTDELRERSPGFSAEIVEYFDSGIKVLQGLGWIRRSTDIVTGNQYKITVEGLRALQELNKLASARAR
jgi:hypothetical protein